MFKRLTTALLGMIGISHSDHSHRIAKVAYSGPVNTPMLNRISFGGHFRPTGPPPASYAPRNQRKARKNFRRRIAAGCTKQ